MHRQENNPNSIKFMCEAVSRLESQRKPRSLIKTQSTVSQNVSYVTFFSFAKKKNSFLSGCECKAYFLLGTPFLRSKTVFQKCGAVKRKIINSKLLAVLDLFAKGSKQCP